MILSENRIENLLLLLLTVDDQHQLLLPIKWFFQNLKLAAQKRFLNTKLSLLRLSGSRRKRLKVGHTLK